MVLSIIELNTIIDNSGDAPNNPKPGFTTIRFGSGPGNRGELDKYCVVPRVSWGLCVFLMYVISLRIFIIPLAS